MCYSKSFCTTLQWRNVFEIRHYVIFQQKNKHLQTLVQLYYGSFKLSEVIEVFKHAERQSLELLQETTAESYSRAEMLK